MCGAVQLTLDTRADIERYLRLTSAGTRSSAGVGVVWAAGADGSSPAMTFLKAAWHYRKRPAIGKALERRKPANPRMSW